MLTEPGRIEIRDVDEPKSDGEAVVEIRSVGICGTDLSIFKGKIPVAYPRIMGHEMVGTVLQLPADPRPGTPPVGSRVIVDPNVSCGRCERCREGRANLCSQGWLLGRDRDGALRRRIAAPHENLYLVPEALDDHLVPLIQVLTTCVHGQRLGRIFPGDAVAIVGMGVTGLLHLQLARMRGARPVVCITRSEQKLELARRLGADETISAADPDLVEKAWAATGGGADLAIECAGTVETLGHAVRIARSGGRVLAYGTIASTDGPFPFYDLYYKELAVTSPRAAQAEDYPVAIGAVETGAVQLTPLVTDRVPLAEVGDALAAGGASGGLKLIVDV